MLLYLSFILLCFQIISIPQLNKLPILKPQSYASITIPEPSDIATDNSFYYIVSDRGRLYKTDLNGKVVKRADFEGVDFEAVCIVDEMVIVVDEGVRQVHYFDKQTLQKTKTIILANQSATNRGVEGIAYVQDQKLLYLFTEKEPASCYVYNENWQLQDYFIIKGISDISAACYHNQKMWLLSDEDVSLFELNLSNKMVERKYRLNLINPEGICIQSNGILTVCSDDMQKLFHYQAF